MGKSKLVALKFVQGIPLSLEGLDMNSYNAVECRKDRYTLSHIKFFDNMGDEGIAFTAILNHNGKPVCRVSNDGNGGIAIPEALDIKSKAIMASVGVKLKNFSWTIGEHEEVLTINWIADTLAWGEYSKLKR